jgi:hypothetical protein
MRAASKSLLLFTVAAATGCTTVSPNSVDYPRNAVDFSAKGKAVLLIASSPKSACAIAQVSTLRLFKFSNSTPKADDKWVDGVGLNAEIFKSDLATRRTFLQAFQLDPGEYRFELYFPASVLGFYRKPDLWPAMRLAAGEIRYVGNVESEGCGPIQMRVANDWDQLRPAFQRLFPGLPAGSIAVKPMNLSPER